MISFESPDPIDIRSDPVNLRSDPVEIRPDPVDIRPDPVNFSPDPLVNSAANQTNRLISTLDIDLSFDSECIYWVSQK